MKPTKPLAWRRRIPAATEDARPDVLQLVIDALTNPTSKLSRVLRSSCAAAGSVPTTYFVHRNRRPDEGLQR